MSLLLLGIGVLLASGALALVVGRYPRVASAVGALGAVAGCAIGLRAAVPAALSGSVETLERAWCAPYGALVLQIDALSAFFLVPVLGLSALAAVYGWQYLLARADRGGLGAAWFFFNMLVASMAAVLVARSAVLFLVAWEVMSLASFFLVTFDDQKESVRRAGWTYLAATHLGTAFLLALFILLGGEGGGDAAGAALATGRAAPAGRSLLFVLAVVGFGTKAGFMPLHVWLPEAHPAAPSHVSALMSGVMIKTGIYGLVRTLTLLGTPPAWWGWLLIGIGLTSGVLGVVFALAQHDLKRLLAYHSVENIGIIALGLGVGVLGLSLDMPRLAVLGIAGGLLHVINHALFKGLLFLGAGAVIHETGTGDLDRLGGLLRRMPWTGLAFLVGAAAITGLPPLNGFVSEWLIFVGAVGGVAGGAGPSLLVLAGTVAGLGLIGGLAAACFAKAFGIVFLGEPRSSEAALAHEVGAAQRWPMAALAVGCLAVAFLGPAVVGRMTPVVMAATGLEGRVASEALSEAGGALGRVVAVSAVLVALVVGLALLRALLLRGRSVTRAGTWDCGYVRPSARMQYTASSFAQPLTRMFELILRTRTTGKAVAEGCFPAEAELATETPDLCREVLWRPVFRGVAEAAGRLRWVQHGHVQVYVLYIALSLLGLLIWKLD